MTKKTNPTTPQHQQSRLPHEAQALPTVASNLTGPSVENVDLFDNKFKYHIKVPLERFEERRKIVGWRLESDDYSDSQIAEIARKEVIDEISEVIRINKASIFLEWARGANIVVKEIKDQ